MHTPVNPSIFFNLYFLEKIRLDSPCESSVGQKIIIKCLVLFSLKKIFKEIENVVCCKFRLTLNGSVQKYRAEITCLINYHHNSNKLSLFDQRNTEIKLSHHENMPI